MRKITRKMRQRRDAREWERLLRNASPSMRQELQALASRQDIHLL